MSRAPAVELAPGVHRIPTAPADLVNAFAVLADDGQVTLVDCGMRRAPGRILAGLRFLDIAPSDVTRIVVTHAHPDHAGGLARMCAQTGAAVAVHARDADHIRTGMAPARDPSSGLLRRVGPRRFPPVEVAEILTDGQVLPGGLRVVHTPGHTPGHISLLHEPTRVLLAGDALLHLRGLRWPLSIFSTDIGLSHETGARLADLDYQVAAFAHGPELRGRARESVRAFLRRQGVVGE